MIVEQDREAGGWTSVPRMKPPPTVLAGLTALSVFLAATGTPSVIFAQQSSEEQSTSGQPVHNTPTVTNGRRELPPAGQRITPNPKIEPTRGVGVEDRSR